MDDRFNIRRYMDYLNPDSQIREELQNRSNPYITSPFVNAAPRPGTTFTDLDATTTRPMDPFEDYQGPSTLAALNQGLQIAQTAPRFLNMKVGDQTLGQSLGLRSNAGTRLGNPFTGNVSQGSFIAPPTASSIVGPGAPAGTQAIFNPTTGAQGAVLPGTPIPAGFEAAPAQLSAGQMASNYFQNLKAGSISAGLPTYLAGRAIRSAFDDDDPTSFTAGEMLGAGISGAGAGSALAPMLGLSGPLGIGLGVAISLLGGRRKRNKARKLQREYQQALKKRDREIREQYNESIKEARKEREGQARAADYMRSAAAFSNPYGLGNMEDGGKMPEYFLGGILESALGGIMDAVGGVFGAAQSVSQTTLDALTNLGFNTLDITADVAQTAAQPAFEVADVVGDTVIEPVVEGVVQPALDVAFEGVEAVGGVVEEGIEAGLNLAGDAINLVGETVQTGMEGISQFANPLIENTLGLAAPLVAGIGQTITDPFMPNREDTSIEPPRLPNIEQASEVQGPNIQTINPYTDTNIKEKALDFSQMLASAGFVRPESEVTKNIYTQTQESV